MRHEFGDGKYTVINDNGELTALRYGKPWGRDLVGDNLVYWMLVEVDRLKADNLDLRRDEALNEAEAEIARLKIYKEWYDEAMVASNVAGYSAVTAAQTISDLDSEREAQAAEIERLGIESGKLAMSLGSAVAERDAARLTALNDVAVIATVGATYPELMQYLQSEIAVLTPVAG